ncbi:RNA polymerase sigma-70 factor [Echinicola vietnamensis]|uniref:RNA polymerase sigma-70 factor, expansion family 1 n=1 Tax=Echinicola vietnamensis (strain DSM 17526 / LMG 23754 / KMM 6221) TaxID=926556 RepID=L0G1Q5_ECHVK|nr:RNA polymerase sigma-70 factor [Echinicola vietnamensis]AGA80134.1 RNA polymerase sigma-70 factor, expansion family 1 [Echinicola vietnamensis DSM 17526]
MHTDLSEIAFRIKQSDKSAFHEFYQLFHKRIYFFCIHYGLKSSDAEEITQDVFVKFWCSRKNIDPEKCIKAYLFMISKNTILDMLRKSIRSKANKTYQMNLILPVNNTENTLEYNELMGIVEKTLTALPERRRQVFEMSRLQGMSHKEIASNLNISTKTVENHLTLALQNFRQVFQDAKIMSTSLLAFFLT